MQENCQIESCYSIRWILILPFLIGHFEAEIWWVHDILPFRDSYEQ